MTSKAHDDAINLACEVDGFVKTSFNWFCFALYCNYSIGGDIGKPLYCCEELFQKMRQCKNDSALKRLRREYDKVIESYALEAALLQKEEALADEWGDESRPTDYYSCGSDFEECKSLEELRKLFLHGLLFLPDCWRYNAKDNVIEALEVIDTSPVKWSTLEKASRIHDLFFYGIGEGRSFGQPSITICTFRLADRTVAHHDLYTAFCITEMPDIYAIQYGGKRWLEDGYMCTDYTDRHLMKAYQDRFDPEYGERVNLTFCRPKEHASA